MTRAPDCLLAVRRLLLEHLNIDTGAVRSADLEPAEVGIVGDAAHVGEGNSYHLGLPEQSSTGYAATESPRDKSGLCEYASALDVGDFSISVAGKRHDLRSFSVWLVSQCKANTADTRDIREVIYSPDGATVKRWDRLGKRSSGDSSHLWHTHISFFRDSTKANRDQAPLFRRYLTTIGLLEDDMLTKADIDAIALRVWTWDLRNGDGVDEAYKVLNRAATAAVVAAGADPVDEAAVAAELLKVLTPQAIAAAIPSALTQQVADELAARLAG